MKEIGEKNNILLQTDNYDNLDIYSYISFDKFKELSGMIFSVHLILPNVADCYAQILLKPSFQN